jgi:hypothetical protein
LTSQVVVVDVDGEYSVSKLDSDSSLIECRLEHGSVFGGLGIFEFDFLPLGYRWPLGAALDWKQYGSLVLEKLVVDIDQLEVDWVSTVGVQVGVVIVCHNKW